MNKLIVAVIVGVLGLTLFLSMAPFTQVETGEVGVVMRLGKIDRVLPPGFHYKTPLIESVEIMDTQLQKAEATADAATKDKQQVITKIDVNFRIDETKAAEIWTDLRNDYMTRVITPAIQESVKQHTAKYTIDELLALREEVKGKIGESIKLALAQNNILVETVYITNFSFSESVNKAIEETAKAKQEALRAEQELARVQFEAQQQIEKARADAEAIRLSSDAANNPRYVELKKLEVQLEFAKKWNGNVPQNMYGSSPIPFVNVEGK